MKKDDLIDSLFDAAVDGDLDAVASILNRHPSLVSVPRLAGLEQPLHFAAEHGRAEMVRFLLGRGAPVDARDRQGMTPLHCAAHRGNREAAECLLAAGADPKALDICGGSVLHWAMQVHDPAQRAAVVDLLLKHGLRLDLYCALILGDLELARRLLEEPIELSSGAFLDSLLGAALCAAIPFAPGFAEATEKSHATCREIAGIIRTMVEKGASLDQFDNVLKGSVKLNNTIIAECLLEVGAEQSLLSDLRRQQLAPHLSYLCHNSVAWREMTELLNRRGFFVNPTVQREMTEFINRHGSFK